MFYSVVQRKQMFTGRIYTTHILGRKANKAGEVEPHTGAGKSAETLYLNGREQGSELFLQRRMN